MRKRAGQSIDTALFHKELNYGTYNNPVGKEVAVLAVAGIEFSLLRLAQRMAKETPRITDDSVVHYAATHPHARRVTRGVVWCIPRSVRPTDTRYFRRRGLGDVDPKQKKEKKEKKSSSKKSGGASPAAAASSSS